MAYRNGVELTSTCGGALTSTNNTMELQSLFNVAAWINRENANERTTVWLDSAGGELRPIWGNNGWQKVRANSRTRSRKIND